MIFLRTFMIRLQMYVCSNDYKAKASLDAVQSSSAIAAKFSSHDEFFLAIELGYIYEAPTVRAFSCAPHHLRLGTLVVCASAHLLYITVPILDRSCTWRGERVWISAICCMLRSILVNEELFRSVAQIEKLKKIAVQFETFF